ncbi:MAG TPA: methyltransferase domain-containing protein [Casimicrobiaceae bacterium]
MRFRAIGRLVTREVLGRDAVLGDLEPQRHIRGLGLSDADAYARPLAHAFAYENTYFHTAPRLDILDVPEGRRGRYDFVIASDVFEHVAPPVARAFENARTLLAPGGALVFTVPFTLDAQTIEHYPDLHDWRLDERDGRWRVLNTTGDGREQVFDDPVFHGGPGTTLEMRVFSLAALQRHFADAGFARVRVADESCDAFGIAWPEPWSVPIVAYA